VIDATAIEFYVEPLSFVALVGGFALAVLVGLLIRATVA